ncbi:MAG: endolytic transglycosylase MltG [Betaproteobacteria bacterium]|nr:endolytic transglycosylase MltG [Betaproteobacteria bacterium]
MVRTFKFVLLLVILAFVAGIMGVSWFTTRQLPMRSDPTMFSIPAGASLRTAAQVIESAGIDLPAWQLELLGRVMGRSSKIKAGSYEVEDGLTALTLLDKLTRGDVTQGELVLVEGKTFRQFRAMINEHPDLAHDSQKFSDAKILAHLGIKETHPEGLFFPDTYLFNKGSSDFDVLRRAYKAMQPKLAAAWEKRETTLPVKTPYELLILASIVEKETGLAADRPQIAAVFVNRLRRGMLLQTDPTVIYGLGERFDGNLRKADLLADTPWNTYTRPGLPPTPIAMPSLASLQAAAKPPPSDMLYFVARGDGSSEFSATLDEHNSAVAKYQKKQ